MCACAAPYAWSLCPYVSESNSLTETAPKPMRGPAPLGAPSSARLACLAPPRGAKPSHSAMQAKPCRAGDKVISRTAGSGHHAPPLSRVTPHPITLPRTTRSHAHTLTVEASVLCSLVRAQYLSHGLQPHTPRLLGGPAPSGAPTGQAARRHPIPRAYASYCATTIANLIRRLLYAHQVHSCGCRKPVQSTIWVCTIRKCVRMYDVRQGPYILPFLRIAYVY